MKELLKKLLVGGTLVAGAGTIAVTLSESPAEHQARLQREVEECLLSPICVRCLEFRKEEGLSPLAAVGQCR